jgi:glucokinase
LKYGKGKNLKNFIVITLGTGLGCGLIINGELYHGHNSLAGELGHVNAIPEGRLCGCGKNGCLETYASATGLRTTILEMLNVQKVPSLLRNIDTKDITSKVIYDAAIQKDALALRAFDFTGKILGEKLADIIEIFDPEAIFFFGGLAESGEILIEPVRKYMENSLMSIFKNKVRLEQSGLIEKNAAILGACALI